MSTHFIRGLPVVQAEIVAQKMIDCAVEGRTPILRPQTLWRCEEVNGQGLRYFLTFGEQPASRTWLSDEKAAVWMDRIDDRD
jgi:hypothetical protein